MSDLHEMTRVICRHDFVNVEQWVTSLNQLADLSDDEIEALERLAKERPMPARAYR